MENLFWVVAGVALATLLFAYWRYRFVMKHHAGNENMRAIASYIREGSDSYLRQQLKVVAIFFAAVSLLLLLMAFLGHMSMFSWAAFLTGGTVTALSGIIGMKVATKANVRTAEAATDKKHGLNKALRVAFASGSVMGFAMNALTLLSVAAWYLLLSFVFNAELEVIGDTMKSLGMGIAFMAMFSRVGGGIFTKAADVGADLVGKVEAGIPEDDPRNPAVIADNVGDNVGDVAGMGADLTESYGNALVAAFVIGIASGHGFAGLLLPLLISAAGIVASMIGCAVVRTKEGANQKSLLHSLHRGTWTAGILAIIFILPITFFVANSEGAETMAPHALGLFITSAIGIVVGFLVGQFTEMYTSAAHKPTLDLAKSYKSGVAIGILSGISLGKKSVAWPILTVLAATVGSFILSGGLGEGENSFNNGLFGIGLAAVSMLATVAVGLATDAFGPVADNAGGIAEMAKLPEDVRERTDALDSLGNTTAATGKGFAICSTCLTAVALLAAYYNAAATALGEDFNASVLNIPVLVGIAAGGMIAFLFAGLTIGSVQQAAGGIVREVRRQFKEIKGLAEGDPNAKADYDKCVKICTQSAQKGMILPSLLTFLSPIVMGLLLGPAGVLGLLAGVIFVGFPKAIYMMCSGGAWDNSKKYIEQGNYGGKNSEAHKAAVVGDTIGDPFKDTTGPAYNLLITLSSTVALVFVNLAANFNLWGLVA